MRWRLLALVSLGVNVGLAALWLAARSSPNSKDVTGNLLASAETDAPKTNLVVRRQLFDWHEVESSDYATYIANLRQIGCPEQTIRDIIIADVNALYSRRRANEIVTTEQQWWRSEPDPEIARTAQEKARALEEERRSLLTSLLGISWESGDLVSLPRPTRPGIILDGPVLGALPNKTKQAIQEINARSQERITAYLAEKTQSGAQADPRDLARFRQQLRNELSAVLAPGQLEEYLLRYSQTAYELRTELGQLQYFNASPDEFRAVFRATDALDQRIQDVPEDQPNAAEVRARLEEQKENAIRLALGNKRYEEYRMLHDPLYRDALLAAQEAGTPKAARQIYQVNLAVAAEQADLDANEELSASQKAIASKQLELDQLMAKAALTGQESAPGAPPLPPDVPRRTYVIRPGDNLSVVALIYGVPVSALRQANPHLNVNRLRPGDSINIPPTIRIPLTAP